MPSQKLRPVQKSAPGLLKKKTTTTTPCRISNNGAQITSTYSIYRDLFKSLFGISAQYTQIIHISIKDLRVCANNPKLEDFIIRNHY